LDRLVLIARLKEGASERARELATAGPETDPAADGFRRIGVFLAPNEIVLVLEGPDAEQIVRGLLNDPVRSTAISPWLPLFDGPLHQAVEIYGWPSKD
jgi:hypothetical protein